LQKWKVDELSAFLQASFVVLLCRMAMNYPLFCMAHFPTWWYNSSIIKFDMKRIFAMTQMVFAQQRSI